MCRGDNVQCKECSRVRKRLVEVCIRGEQGYCSEIIFEGVSLEREECLLCRYGNANGRVIMPSSIFVIANNYDKEAWRASKERLLPRPVQYQHPGLRYRVSSDSFLSSGSEASSWPMFPEESQLFDDLSTSQQSDPCQEMDPESVTVVYGSMVQQKPHGKKTIKKTLVLAVNMLKRCIRCRCRRDRSAY